MRSIESIIDTLNGIHNLPTLPVVMQKLSAAIRDPNSDARSIARLIEDDPAISSRILKVVNSSLYAGGTKIDSVQQAVSRLGMTATNNIALSTAILSAFDGDRPQSFDRPAFWRHSICVGIAACVIYDHAAQNLKKRQSRETLRLVGLLHDVGKLILDIYMYDDFRAALDMVAADPMPLFKAELETIGVDHPTLGGWILGKWNMADELMLPTLWHHDPNSAPNDHWELTAIVHVANYVCNLQKIGDGGDLRSPTFEKDVWKRLGLSVGDISVIVDEVEEESSKSDILEALL
jgi:HD-like signal output (HDOD) protein